MAVKYVNYIFFTMFFIYISYNSLSFYTANGIMSIRHPYLCRIVLTYFYYYHAEAILCIPVYAVILQVQHILYIFR